MKSDKASVIGNVEYPHCSNKQCEHNKNKICEIIPGYSRGFICHNNTAGNEVYFDSDRIAHVRKVKK